MNEQLIKSTSSEFPPYVEFKDLPDTTTPVDATNLNALQSLMRQDIQDNQSVPIGGVTGQVLGKASNTDYDVEWIYQAGTNYDSLPVGAILPYGSLTPPTGYLVCDGSAVSRTEYAGLFSVIGTSFGEGDGTTTFNLPNIDGRGIVGFSSSDNDFNTIGKTGGSKTHTQTVDELASHKHTFSSNWGRDKGSSGFGASIIENTGYVFESSSLNNHINNAGDSQPMDIMNPYIVACYIIKAYGTAILTGNIVDSLDDNSTTLAPSQNAVNTAINSLTYNLVTDGEPVKVGRLVDGKEEYCKRVNFGSLPNNTVKNVSTGLSSSAKITRFDGICSDGKPLNYIDAVTSSNSISCRVTSSNITVITWGNLSNVTAVVDVYYTND